MQKFNDLGSVMTDNGKWDTEILSCSGIAKDTLVKLSKVLRNKINATVNKENSAKLDM